MTLKVSIIDFAHGGGEGVQTKLSKQKSTLPLKLI